MIVINVHGRLAHQPELKMLGNGGAVCEFRLLSSRFAKGEEVTEAVTFFCFDAEAEKFCETAEKGQLISASGTQETLHRRQRREEVVHQVQDDLARQRCTASQLAAGRTRLGGQWHAAIRKRSLRRWPTGSKQHASERCRREPLQLRIGAADRAAPATEPTRWRIPLTRAARQQRWLG
jgi:single-stranded DNA-binding protein